MMARKNNVKTDNSGVILFDSRTKAVMAEVPQSQENIKEKVNAVREVVLGKSNNEIILVLQYYDYNVEKAIQAYLEDGAKSALTEWRFSGPKVANKKKKNKKKLGKTGNGDDMSPTQNGDVSDHIGEALANGVLENGTCAIKLGIEAETTGGGGGEHITGPDLPASASTVNGAVPSTVPSHDQGAGASEVTPQSHDQGAESSQASQSLPQRQPHQNHHKQRLHSGSHSSSNRQRSASERSTSSNPSSDSRPVKRKVHGGMEKSMKDLHRQTVSLERLRLVMNEEVEKNFKRIKSVFEEVRTCLNKREADLLVEMEKVKAVANNTFASRQKTGADLKVMVDRSETMSEEELAKLRTDIKHFIGDRKIDEELSRTTRFLYDSDFLKLEVGRFGEVVPAKTAYSSHPAYVVVNKPTVEPARVEPPRVEPVEPHPVVNQAKYSLKKSFIHQDNKIISIHQVILSFVTYYKCELSPLCRAWTVQIQTRVAGQPQLLPLSSLLSLGKHPRLVVHMTNAEAVGNDLDVMDQGVAIVGKVALEGVMMDQEVAMVGTEALEGVTIMMEAPERGTITMEALEEGITETEVVDKMNTTTVARLHKDLTTLSISVVSHSPEGVAVEAVQGGVVQEDPGVLGKMVPGDPGTPLEVRAMVHREAAIDPSLVQNLLRKTNWSQLWCSRTGHVQ
ncbi:Spermatogenesis-associated serine-rich protein 2 [Mizuhopecten yessoensis]|uniref:Spermatogenesis-associated serine-rich protein 2 n=1 Tax=Mizuhopecten yessoensis TaxID=6573 RepID=A0A210Q8T5_MIZYE|nr:Spermatogenesis-associated serine-rich protein 2 [Mizuhopecten yessoensis]